MLIPGHCPAAPDGQFTYWSCVALIGPKQLQESHLGMGLRSECAFALENILEGLRKPRMQPASFTSTVPVSHVFCSL